MSRFCSCPSIALSVPEGASIKHRVSPSKLTALAYHRRGATPLMRLDCKDRFEDIAVLLNYPKCSGFWGFYVGVSGSAYWGIG